MLVALAALLALAAGCQADRFNDGGCESDGQCRSDRVCHVGRCLAPDQLDQSQTDAGVDVDQAGAAQFLGRWDTTVSGRVTEPNGQVSDIEPDTQIVEIREGQDSDLIIEMVDAQGFCELPANLSADGFDLVDESCTLTDGGQTVTYDDITGSGRIDADGELTFNMNANIEFDMVDAPGAVIEIELTFAGPRLQD
jgi:hypothetical protein